MSGPSQPRHIEGDGAGRGMCGRRLTPWPEHGGVGLTAARNDHLHRQRSAAAVDVQDLLDSGHPGPGGHRGPDTHHRLAMDRPGGRQAERARQVDELRYDRGHRHPAGDGAISGLVRGRGGADDQPATGLHVRRQSREAQVRLEPEVVAVHIGLGPDEDGGHAAALCAFADSDGLEAVTSAGLGHHGCRVGTRVLVGRPVDGGLGSGGSQSRGQDRQRAARPLRGRRHHRGHRSGKSEAAHHQHGAKSQPGCGAGISHDDLSAGYQRALTVGRHHRCRMIGE